MSNDAKKRGLGRGLAALLADTAGDLPVASALPVTAERVGIRTVATSALSPNPHQPRSRFDDTALAELAESIRVHGIIQPLVVTVVPGRADAYWIVAGERRWRAAAIAGLDQVPIVLREASPRQLMELALVENVQREDLSPLEEAAAYQALLDEHGLTQAEVAERVGKSRPAVANTLRLLNLPLAAQQAVTDGRITAGHARALLALPETAELLTAMHEVIQHDLSVRQTELLVKRLLDAPPPPAPKQVDPRLAAHLGELENRFRKAFSTKVSLQRNDDGSGRLVVHFYNDEDLEAIYRLIAHETGDDIEEL